MIISRLLRVFASLAVLVPVAAKKETIEGLAEIWRSYDAKISYLSVIDEYICRATMKNSIHENVHIIMKLNEELQRRKWRDEQLRMDLLKKVSSVVRLIRLSTEGQICNHWAQVISANADIQVIKHLRDFDRPGRRIVRR